MPADEDNVDLEALRPLIEDAKRVARAYYAATGKPLGITGEVAEFETARLLGLRLRRAREPGTDALGPDGRRYQIKGRVLQPGTKDGRLSKLDFDKAWDIAILALLNADYEPVAFYEAERTALESARDASNSKAIRDRGQFPINRFRNLARWEWAPPFAAARAGGVAPNSQ